jgi:2-oxoglutarate dehydrogenase E2 component (dihydrolipoamide succinyltransferase)
VEDDMPVEIRVPALGESVVDATVAAWRKQEGDPVTQGEVLVELETDKVNLEVSAEQSGVLQKIVKQQGETVGVGEVLAVIAEGAADGASAAQPTPSAPAAEKPSAQQNQAPVTPEAPSQREAAPAAPQMPAASNAAPAEPAAATPLARRIAAEHNIDLAQIRPEHGRVTKEDVLGYLEQRSAHPAEQAAQPAEAVETAPQRPSGPPGLPAPTPTAPSAPAAPPVVGLAPRGREERVRMSRRRQTIAQRLVQTQHNAAMLTTFNEVDMSAIMEVRRRRKDSFKERHGVSLGFMSFFTKATVGALKAFPRLNAEIQGDEMVLKYYYDIGIAVGAEEGLVVPVLRDADRKSFAEIEREIADLAKRAREGTLTLSELQGGTFTITNGGVFGSLMSTPILNGPQVGILGMHKIEERPIALNGQVVIRPMMYLAVSYDHRIVDGREAVQFLVRIKELLEDPETLLLEG